MHEEDGIILTAIAIPGDCGVARARAADVPELSVQAETQVPIPAVTCSPTAAGLWYESLLAWAGTIPSYAQIALLHCASWWMLCVCVEGTQGLDTMK